MLRLLAAGGDDGALHYRYAEQAGCMGTASSQ